MIEKINELEPKRVLHYFKEISKIPRCSKKEKNVSDFLINWAKSKNLIAIQDKALNVIIYKKASKGYENSQTVILQGHMDMVCEKNSDTVHDFDIEPIKLLLKGDYLYADGTTLGGDNGIAVAMILAILESDSVSHPPIEALITTDEENGMSGVLNLDGSLLEGRLLLNLDSEGEGIFTVGCAGGGRINFVAPIKRDTKKLLKPVLINIKGLLGGHSGAEIHLDRANSNKLMGRLLYEIRDIVELVKVEGGAADNAIPREASCLIMTDNIDVLNLRINNMLEIFKNEYKFSDPHITFEIRESDENVTEVFTKEMFTDYLNLINLVPYGPLKINNEINLVIQSNNPGVVRIEDNKLIIRCASRSSIKSLIDDFLGKMNQLADITGFTLEKGAFYPGWEYAKESYIRDLCIKVYTDNFKIKPQVMAIHAGLECGFLIEKIPELDAISFGPDMYDIHTPEEHLSISSTKRTYDLLINILSNIN